MRPRHREAAMMANETLTESVIDQPGIADGAGKAMPAGPAQRQRRVAATVEEQQRLLAPLDRRLDLRSEPWRDKAAARGRLAAQIDRLDMGHLRTPEPRRQHHELIA